VHQLALDIRLAEYAVFDSFFVGPNGGAVHHLREATSGTTQGVTWLWGLSGSGRSHLLQACVSDAAESGRASLYLPLSDGLGLAPEMLQDMGKDRLVCIDDIDTVAGDPEWERALFMLYEESRQSLGTVVAAGAGPPGGTGFALDDLKSRLSSGATFRLGPLNETEMLGALQLRAHWRGLELPDRTGRYLLTRAERSAANLFAVLDRLVEESLNLQKRLTVPFVRQTIAGGLTI
jgi:DnaA family protein